MAKFKFDSLEESNAQVLVDLVTDAATSEHLRIQILEKLKEGKKGNTFFQTMLQERLSWGQCPCCDHKNHWLIPEDDLNQMDYVTSKIDPGVSENVTAKECPEFQEACRKKRITV